MKRNIARHCKSMHDCDTRYLKEGKKPPEPYYCDWWQRQQNPERGIIAERDNESESEHASQVQNEELVDVKSLDDHSG